jgi:HAD superfamily hydrolase (TIGR01457 family)
MANSEHARDIALSDLRGFILDMDGVIYRGNTALPGAAEFLAALRAAGVPFLFLTNNATTPARLVAERLKGMGIPANRADVLTSSEATASALAAEMPGCRVFVVGEVGLWEALSEAGLQLTDRHDQADAVVVGLDRDCTYARLRDAALAIGRGARFIATNADRSLPTEIGFIPGAGALVGALQIATDVEPRVIGKPSREIFVFALHRLGTKADRTAAVGDRPETDIVGGQRAGLRTIAMLTGAGKAEEFVALQPPPGWIFRDLVELRQAYFGA